MRAIARRGVHAAGQKYRRDIAHLTRPGHQPNSEMTATNTALAYYSRPLRTGRARCRGLRDL